MTSSTTTSLEPKPWPASKVYVLHPDLIGAASQRWHISSSGPYSAPTIAVGGHDPGRPTSAPTSHCHPRPAGRDGRRQQPGKHRPVGELAPRPGPLVRTAPTSGYCGWRAEVRALRRAAVGHPAPNRAERHLAEAGGQCQPIPSARKSATVASGSRRRSGTSAALLRKQITKSSETVNTGPTLPSGGPGSGRQVMHHDAAGTVIPPAPWCRSRAATIASR